MGGSAFKDKFTGVPVNRRMESKQDFLDTFNAQVDLLGHLFPMRLPHQINSKTSFGDIDIIVPTGHLEAVYEVLRENELPFFTNGIVVSYLTHDKVQIDLINIDPSKIEYAVKYFSYGDHGNILGRILKHELNVKNSFNGLYYIYRNERFKRDILLSMDYDDVFKLLKRILTVCNELNIQIIFATNNTRVLNHPYIQYDEIWLNEYDKLKDTFDFYSLVEIPDIHRYKNIEKSYLNGTFGGTPFIPHI